MFFSFFFFFFFFFPISITRTQYEYEYAARGRIWPTRAKVWSQFTQSPNGYIGAILWPNSAKSCGEGFLELWLPLDFLWKHPGLLINWGHGPRILSFRLHWKTLGPVNLDVQKAPCTSSRADLTVQKALCTSRRTGLIVQKALCTCRYTSARDTKSLTRLAKTGPAILIPCLKQTLRHQVL